MAYPYILALLDEEIARLERVRELLAAQPEPIVLSPPSNDTLDLPFSEQPVQLPLTPKTRRPRKAETTPRASRTRKPAPIIAGALSGSIPAGPVAISADVARQGQSLRLEATREKESAASSQPLSAEMLLQRWLQPKNRGENNGIS